MTEQQLPDQSVAAGRVRRLQPQARHVMIPLGMEALIVRAGEPGRTLPGGTSPRVRRRLQPAPELYLFPTAPAALHLWLSELTSADGLPVNLGWRVQVQIADVRRYWSAWLRLQEADDIDLPHGQISARLADPARQIAQRYTLADLRDDADIRAFFAGELGRLLRGVLEEFGLELGAAYDEAQLRFVTDADLAAAEAARAALVAAADAAAKDAQLRQIDDVEAMRAGLQAWQANLEPRVARRIDKARLEQAAIELAGDNPPPMAQVLQALLDADAAPAPVSVDAATPHVVPIAPPVHAGRWHVLRHVGEFLGIATVVGAAVLAAIAYFEPQMLHVDNGRNWVIGGVMGFVLLGLVLAWIVDQFMRWEAQRAAQRILRAADLNHADHGIGQLELRHMLMLLGALVGITAAAVSLWLPDYYRWFRLAGAVIGVVGAGYAIRVDWLRNVQVSNEMMAQAQRQVTSARLNDAQRARRHRQLKTELRAELEVTAHRLDETLPLVYRTLQDRALYRRCRTLQETVAALLPQVDALEAAHHDHTLPEWEQVDQAVGRLQELAEDCSAEAATLFTAAQQGDGDAAAISQQRLEQALQDLYDTVTRWQAVAA